MLRRQPHTVLKASLGGLAAAAVAAVALAGSATAVSALPTWPADPNWQSHVPGPASDDVKPVDVVERLPLSANERDTIVGGNAARLLKVA